MYIVEITNGKKTTTIHGKNVKLSSGKINKGINTIDSFTFSMTPNNPGFASIKEFTTHVTVYNTNRERYEFMGRALYAETTMSESGLITKNVTCESLFGYLCDSWQIYTDTQNWTVAGLLQHLLDCHNSQVEDYKQFKLGTVTASDSNDNLYQAVQRENTWDSIKSKLLDKIGGELQFRVEDDGIYLDYLDRIGEDKQTEIALSKNMKSITKEQDPTSYVTRLIPLGCKLTVDGEETEHRLDISAIQSGGKIYIDDEDAIALYGVHVKVVEWDDVTTASALLSKGQNWMKQNNRVQVKYTVTALDLSLIGKVVDDFDVGNTHPIANGLIGVEDTSRIIKKAIDICEEIKSSFEVGDNLKTLSDIQRDQTEQIKAASQGVQSMVSEQKKEYNQALQTQKTEITEEYQSAIEQLSKSIKLEVSGSLGSKASIILSAGANKYSYDMDLSQIRKAFADDKTAISISAGLITFNAGTLIINSSKFTLDSAGKITARDAVVYGDIITVDGSFKTEMDKGSLRLYYSDVLCGTINTKYWSGASTEGISLRVEEGGNYIMFSHADDTQGSGYVVDYYLNAGWSSNYDEMHIFQTSARFLDDAYFAGKTRIRSLRLFGSDGEYLVGINSSGTGLSVSKL
jgi:phage minor structural protein